MAIYETIIWGVVAGIITSTLLFIAGLIFAKVLIPWYQGVIYDGVDLGGLWIEDKDFKDGSH